jgi:hypothetical protein
MTAEQRTVTSKAAIFKRKVPALYCMRQMAVVGFVVQVLVVMYCTSHCITHSFFVTASWLERGLIFLTVYLTYSVPGRLPVQVKRKKFLAWLADCAGLCLCDWRRHWCHTKLKVSLQYIVRSPIIDSSSAKTLRAQVIDVHDVGVFGHMYTLRTVSHLGQSWVEDVGHSLIPTNTSSESKTKPRGESVLIT